MATVPLSGTNIRFLSGVPFTNDYKHTRWFEVLSSQTSYFTGQTVVHSENQANFQRIEGYHFIAVNKSIDELWSTNYLMFQNASYNNKWFYAFVTKLEYIQRNTTYVHFQIDVLQTWLFEIDFKDSYVIREHCKLWNTDGTPVINTIDEGLNYGTEYDVVSVDHFHPSDGIFWLVIASKQIIEGSNEYNPVLNGIVQPLSYYVMPFKQDGTMPTTTVGGVAVPPIDMRSLLQKLYLADGATNNIVSISVTDYIGTGTTTSTSVALSGSQFEAVMFGEAEDTIIRLNELEDYSTSSTTFTDKYDGYHSVNESKLLMYPYTVLTLTDSKGNSVDYKNEYINSNDISIVSKGSIGTANKVSYYVNSYLQGSLSNGSIPLLGHGVINTDPNDVPVLTDLLSAYLQGNKNSIQVQQKSAVFNGYMGAIGGGISAVASIAQGSVGGLASGLTSVVGSVGNSQLQLQGIQAKQQDIANVPPSISNMGSNTSFDYGNGINGIYLVKRHIKQEYINQLEAYFKQFGYKVNLVKQPNFHTRENYNYIQTNDCNIVGSLNNDDLNEIKKCFDRGITLWHTNDVGNYSLSNEVI